MKVFSLLNSALISYIHIDLNTDMMLRLRKFGQKHTVSTWLETSKRLIQLDFDCTTRYLIVIFFTAHESPEF